MTRQLNCGQTRLAGKRRQGTHGTLEFVFNQENLPIEGNASFVIISESEKLLEKGNSELL